MCVCACVSAETVAPVAATAAIVATVAATVYDDNVAIDSVATAAAAGDAAPSVYLCAS